MTTKKEEKQEIVEPILQQMFRNFIRTHHLSSKWDEFCEANKIAPLQETGRSLEEYEKFDFRSYEQSILKSVESILELKPHDWGTGNGKHISLYANRILSATKLLLKHVSKRYDIIFELGKYYGYPTCCIKQFIEENMNGKDSGIRNIDGSGFIPCDKHFKEIQDGKIIIAELYAQSRQQSQWVSVEDSKPDHQNEVMVFAPDCKIIGSILVGQYFSPENGYEESWTVYDFNQSKLDQKVTHWMNLPTPPKTK